MENLKGGSPGERLDLLDWLKGLAIIAVILDHRLIVPEAFVVWSVNVFVLVTAAIYGKPGLVFSGKKFLRKVVYLFYVIAFAVFFFDFLFTLTGLRYNREVLSVLLNPYYFFVESPYLGNVWYVALHLQMLVLFYFFLKVRPFVKTRTVLIASVVIAVTSYAVTHSLIHRFQTIFIGSWLIYIAAGFYGLRPLLEKIEKYPHNRFLWLSDSFLLLVVIYILYPLFPSEFTNANRCSFLMLPLYFALVVFFSELFWILKGSPAGKWIKFAGSLLGRHTLAIYLTHYAFSLLWRQVSFNPWLDVLLIVGSGILFGMLTDRIFAALQMLTDRIATVLFSHPAANIQNVKAPVPVLRGTGSNNIRFRESRH